jgi:hypothetical protein
MSRDRCVQRAPGLQNGLNFPGDTFTLNSDVGGTLTAEDLKAAGLAGSPR